MIKYEIANTLNYRENALKGVMNDIDRYIDIKTLLGCYDRADCPLNDVDRELIIKHLVFGYTHRELSGEYKLSKTAIGERIKKSIEVLKCTIEEN